MVNRVVNFNQVQKRSDLIGQSLCLLNNTYDSVVRYLLYIMMHPIRIEIWGDSEPHWIQEKNMTFYFIVHCSCHIRMNELKICKKILKKMMMK